MRGVFFGGWKALEMTMRDWSRIPFGAKPHSLFHFGEISMSGLFILNSVLLGVGLAMDAFSVSLANGLANHFLRIRTMCLIAGTFGFFQWLMPMAGWACVNRIVDLFQVLLPLVPWASLVLLVAIGGLMIRDGLSGDEEDVKVSVGLRYLLLQGLATSMDALSVGFTLAEYPFAKAMLASIIIGIVTFSICIAGLFLGKRFGMKLADKATILGGVILIGIGLEIFFGA